jgi:hypothetical protein
MQTKPTPRFLGLGLAFLASTAALNHALADADKYRSALLAEPSILSFYPADGDTGSTLTDRVAPAQNGTLVGATLVSGAGVVGTHALRGARVTLGNVPDYEFADGTGTVEVFLYQTNTAGNNPCFFSGRDDSQSPAVRYSLHGDSAGNRLWIWNGVSAPSVTLPFNMLNRLVHVAYVFEAGLVTVYFNGAPLVTWNEPLGAGIGRSFQIGASGPSAAEGWPGLVDELAVHGEALPADAVAAHYAAWLTTNSGAAPVITQQPQSQNLDAGQMATFSVQLTDATGAIYRWIRNGTNLSGATNATLNLGPVTVADNGSSFRCVIYNPFGGTNTTAATLAVRAPPVIASQPANTVGYMGQSLTLSVVAVGSQPLSYQWYRNSSPLAGATNSSLAFARLDPTNSGWYVLTVTNVYGAASSTGAVLAVVPVVIVTPPADAVRFVGQAVTFNVTAAGLGPLTYQWFHGGSSVGSATNASLTLTQLAPTDAGAFSVVVSNPYGATNSPSASLNVISPNTPMEVRTPPPFEWLPQDKETSADAVVLFNEIMYHPGPGSSPALEWIELQNVMRVDIDISNWQLDGGVHFTFPTNTIVPGGAFVLVAGDLSVFTNATGVTNVFGPFYTNLANSGEHLILRNHDGRLMDELTYGDEQPWPEGADGSGATLSKRIPLAASAEPINWVASVQAGGTPGRPNSPAVAPPLLAINEMDAVTNMQFRVELLNHGVVPLDLAAFSLVTTSTNGATNFLLPTLALQPGQFIVFDAAQTGFHPAQNDKLFLWASNRTVLVDVATMKNQLRARSPDGNGRWLRPTAPSLGASNIVVINRDVVINEIMYEAAPAYSSNVYVGAPEQWVELFNRGTNAVNLTGWSLDNAVRYDFPSNTLLAAGAYLVVAKDAAAVRAMHPGITVLGDFSGKLAKSTDLIELRDPSKTVVNEVRYYASGRWPAYAAGGGSSLELIDPYADNRRAESWAASDETSRTAWQTISYRGLATNNPGYAVGYAIWNELVLGMLDAGEFLLDDVSVVELPGTAQARQLVQNGSFEGDAVGGSPATWRLLGDHGLHGRTVVEADPANPGNKVLHVVASGATDLLHNHLGTTLKNGGSIVSVVAGREYEISFRAKWLGGVRQVNSRLYPKWLQRTTVLDAPSVSGTPGAINSRRVASSGPTYSGLGHAPSVPPAGSAITVKVNAYDPQGVAAMTLWWRPDGGSWNSIPMSLSASGTAPGQFSAIIPGQSAGAKVQFYVQGRDSLGGASFFPPGGPDSRALVMVNDGLAAAQPMPNLRFILTAADTARMYYDTNRMSNDRFGATIISDESEIFYNVGVRLKGSGWGRTHDTEAGLSIDFDPDHKFRGAHDSISIERGGSKREIFAKHLFNQAGKGVVAGYDDVAQIITPRTADVGRGFYSMTRTTDTMLDTEYGSGGTVYNFELLYTPTTTVNGNPEAPKLNFPYAHTSGAPDIQDLGDDKEAYRWNFQLRNNRVRDDSSLMVAAAKAFELNGGAMDTRTRQVMDVDQVLRCFAMESLVGNDDFYTRLYNHNLRFYQRPGDNRLVAVPWDLDRSFNLATTASLWGNVPDAFGGTNRMRKIIEYPGNLRTYYLHLLDLIATCYNTAYATRWADHYAALSGDSSISGYAAYVGGRASYVLSQVPASPAFSITTSNGFDFTANSNLVTLAGTAPYSVRWIRVNGELYDAAWPTVTAWSLQLALPAGTNTLSLQGVDSQGDTVAGAMDTIRVNVSAVMDDPRGRVVINEIMYQPAVPGAEFVELLNTSTTTSFNLAGWRLNGTGLTFSNGTILPPNGFLVLAADRAVFTSTYGTALPVAAEFPGRLDLDGETLTLIKPGANPAEEVIVDRLRYEPGEPWPTKAAGGGISLQLIDAAQDNSRVSNWSDGSDWRYFQFTGPMGASRLSLFFDSSGGDVYLDDLVLVPGSVAGVGTNHVLNGDFEAPLTPPWFFASIATNSHLTNGLARSGNQCLHLIFNPGGASLTSFYEDLLPILTNGVYTLSFWYLPGKTGKSLTLRAGSGFQAKPPVTTAGPTPGATNLVLQSLSPYPPLWINEVQPLNVNGQTSSGGQRAPWAEIYNAGSNALHLDGYWLSDNYTNLAQWAFPTTAVIQPGQFLLVWADGQPGLSSDSEFHTSFRLAPTNGSIALSRPASGAVQLLDYLNYRGVAADSSYGDVPDGQPFYRQTMHYATPGAPNDGRSASIVVFINEWMAANTSASGIADPADGDFEDWFELYNPGPQAVDLGGLFLTDNLTNRFQFEIPKNGHYVIPPGGYLLVWADGETAQNSTAIADLHVSFNLRSAGEAIGLFAADGTQIDVVTFGTQSANVSMGRSPDGSSQIVLQSQPSPRTANLVLPPAPAVTEIAVSDLQVILTFTTEPGLRYRVQFKDDLSVAEWGDLPGDVTATGSSATKTDNYNGSRRFYRVLAWP